MYRNDRAVPEIRIRVKETTRERTSRTLHRFDNHRRQALVGDFAKSDRGMLTTKAGVYSECMDVFGIDFTSRAELGTGSKAATPA